MLTLEALFGFGVLAYVYGFLFLGVFHVAQAVIIGFPLEKEVAHLFEPVIRAIVHRRPLPHVLRVDVRPARQEKGDRVQVAPLACQVERRALLLVYPLELGAVGE